MWLTLATTLRRIDFGTLRWGVNCSVDVLGWMMEGETVVANAGLLMSPLAPELSLKSSKPHEILQSTAIAQGGEHAGSSLVDRGPIFCFLEFSFFSLKSYSADRVYA